MAADKPRSIVTYVHRPKRSPRKEAQAAAATHMPQGDMLIRDIIDRMRHDGCGGRAEKAELLTGIDGSSRRTSDRAEGWRIRSGRPLTGASGVTRRFVQNRTVRRNTPRTLPVGYSDCL
jgi:hypothetical protein